MTIDSGEEVSFDNKNAGFHNIVEGTLDTDLAPLGLTGLQDFEKCTGPIYVDGPVFVHGAEPGDILCVEILQLQVGEWGWTAVFPGLGLLKDEITGPHIRTFDLRNANERGYAVFRPANVELEQPEIRIPHQPFYGTMGVAPPPGDSDNRHPLFPGNDIGGNFDCRYLGEGSTVYVPVNVPGALFSVGDAHFCQGDGEISGTALETSMASRIRLTVLKPPNTGKGTDSFWPSSGTSVPTDLMMIKQLIRSPHYKTNPDRVADMHRIMGRGEFGALATAATRDAAVKEAVSGVLDWLVSTKRVDKVEAYMLFSCAGNLKMMHDLGLDIFTVSASIPLGLFAK